MNYLLFATALFSSNVFAQEWVEAFKLPEGTTYRARAAGYDCGSFGSTYVDTPESFRAHNVEFKQLSADKDLNKFLIEAAYPGVEGQVCKYGVFLDRNRDNKTLDFTHSLIVTSGLEEDCLTTKSFLDEQLVSAAYEGSRRGLRYVAVEVIKDEVNVVCDSDKVRIVFDRRY